MRGDGRCVEGRGRKNERKRASERARASEKRREKERRMVARKREEKQTRLEKEKPTENERERKRETFQNDLWWSPIVIAPSGADWRCVNGKRNFHARF